MERQIHQIKTWNEKNTETYHYRKLYMMSFQQLKQICHKEKIMDQRMHRADKETLIRLILEKCHKEAAAFLEVKNTEDILRIQKIVQTSKMTFFTVPDFEFRDTFVLYEGIPVMRTDGIWFRYEETFANTDVLFIDHNQKLCGIFQMHEFFTSDMKQFLYLSGSIQFLLRDGTGPFSLYLLDKKSSIVLHRAYEGTVGSAGLCINACRVLLHNFSIHETETLQLPLAIAFNASHTILGIEKMGPCSQTKCMTEKSYNEDELSFMSRRLDGEEKTVCTGQMLTAIGIFLEEDKAPQYFFGLTAIHMEQCVYCSRGYYLFFQVRDWLRDQEGIELLFDSAGNAVEIVHRDVLAAYFQYLLDLVKQHWKCSIKEIVFLGNPLDQEYVRQLFFEKFSGISILSPGIFPVGFAGAQCFLQEQQAHDEKYLVLFCDMDHSRADEVTAVDFGRRLRLTKSFSSSFCNQRQMVYRILQVLKLNIAIHFSNEFDEALGNLVQFFTEKRCYYCEDDWKLFCKVLDEAYCEVERLLPTQFALKNKGKSVAYFRIRRNYHLLYDAARRILAKVLDNQGEERVLLSTRLIRDRKACVILAEKGILHVAKDGALKSVQDFPVVSLTMEMLHFLVRAAWYQQFSRVLRPWLETKTVHSFARAAVLGYGAHSDLLRDVLKEFIPGRKITMGKEPQDMMVNLVKNTLLHYKQNSQQILEIDDTQILWDSPYQVIACDCQGNERTLLAVSGKAAKGMVKREFSDVLSVRFYCRDESNRICSEFIYTCQRKEFEEKKIPNTFKGLAQELKDGEVGFFVSRIHPSSVYIAAIYRSMCGLMLGKEQCFTFRERLQADFFAGRK